MKLTVLAVICLTYTLMGHAAEPQTSPPGGSDSGRLDTQSAASNNTTATQDKMPKRLSLMRRLSSQFMETFDADRQALAARLQPITVPYMWTRGTFHLHSRLSHDSIGTIEEIILAAKATGTEIIGFSEHPSHSVDVVAENVKGWHDGVYFLAGTESRNQLHWPSREGEDSLRFVCHCEEVRTFDRTLYDGMEIYNTHSDLKDELTSSAIAALLLNLVAVGEHPEAAFCSFLDYPQDFLARFDRLSASAPFSGIAANDSHQNQRLTVEAQPDGTVVAYDATGESVWKGEGIPARLAMVALGQTRRPTEKMILADIQFDPYEISMRHVGTFLHLQDDQINEHSVREALRGGHAIVGFELIAPLPAVGFWVEHAGSPQGTCGDTVRWKQGLSLHVQLPLDAEIRVVRNGQMFREADSNALVVQSLPEGVYRMEAFQRLAGQRYPWVLSNPINVTGN